MDLDSSDGHAWLLDALASSPLFSAASPPPWPFGEQHSSSQMDAVTAAPDEAPSARSGKSESASTEVKTISGKFQVHVSLDDDFSDSSYFLKERLTLALRYFKESTDQHMLVQVWAPTKNGDRYMLTTSGQPFVLDQQSIRLLQYRAVSMGYAFPVDGDNVHELGLPGRVYRQRIPEWTPDVQYYSSAEYRRLNHAINNNVHGTVALPVFHPSVQSCVAVVELIMTSKKVNYASEVDKVCKALEAVNLKSTDIVEHPYVQSAYTGDDDYILEFFLPPDCREDNEQKALLESIIVLLRQHLRSLQVTSDKGSDEAYVQVDAVTLIHSEEMKNTFHALLESDMHGGIDESDNTNDKVSTVSNKDLLSVCPTTLKRICRQHRISNWPSRQIGKVNRSISRLQKVIEAAQGSESAFNVIAPPRPVPVNLLDIEKARQNETAEPYNHYGEENRGPFSQNLQQDGCKLSAFMSSQTFLANNGTQIEEDKSTNSRSSSGQHSTHSQTSEGSLRGSLGNMTSVCKTFIRPQRNLCNPEVPFEEQDLLLSRMLLKDSVRPTVISSGRIVTVKARYKEDILRFRFPYSGSVSTLKDEVAKRIHIDVGNFVIKYLDDDHEWVNLTCEADLEECMEIYQLSGNSVMRLFVTDIAVVLGSSCGSTA
ncbi:hypothetical protein ACQ4PT_035338 [Festuca glaucescens]